MKLIMLAGRGFFNNVLRPALLSARSRISLGRRRAASVWGPLLVTLIAASPVLRGDPVNVLFDCSHWYKFTNVSTRNYQKYLWPNQDISSFSSLCTIHANDVTNINVIVVYLNDNLPYLSEDGQFLKEFAESGGGVWLVSTGDLGVRVRKPGNPPTRLAMTRMLGIEFQPNTFAVRKNANLRVRGFDGTYATEAGFKANAVKANSDWQVNIADDQGRPLLLGRNLGKGRILASAFNTFAVRYQDKQRDKAEIANPKLLTKFVRLLGGQKRVTVPTDYRPVGFAASPQYQGDVVEKHGSITIHSSQYLKPQIGTMVRSWETKVRPVLEDMTGYDFDIHLKRRGMSSGVDFLMLPVAGSGFAGKIVGLAALGKDAETDMSAYYGILSHECLHFLDAPYSEPLNEESMAIFGGTTAQIVLGQEDKKSTRLKKMYPHPQMFEYDPVRHRTGPAARRYAGDKTLTFGKYMIIMDQLTRHYGGERVRRNYYQLKKYALPWPADTGSWGPHASAYLWSIACSQDLQPLFRAFNMEIDWKSVEHPPLLNLPFDMDAAAAKLKIPRDKYITPETVPVSTVINSLLTDIGRR